MHQFPNEEINAILTEHLRLQEQSTNKQSEFLRAVLISSTSMLGILVALHRTIESPLYIRLVFVVATLSLAVGILMTVIALHYSVRAYRQTHRNYSAECIKALQERRPMNQVPSSGDDRVFQRMQKIAYSFLIIGLFLLTIYAVLPSLFVCF